MADVEKSSGNAPAKPDRQAEMRKAIANLMGRSKKEIPHYYLSGEFSLEKANEWLRAVNAELSLPDRILMPALLLRATAIAVASFPEMNGYFKGGAFVASPAVNLGVAISLRLGGLVAPAILDASRKSVPQLMKALNDLVLRARSGGLRGSEMTESTITVTSLGDQGVESVFGVIYPPQVALVGFGKITERPWVKDGQVRSVPMITATLSGDHRVSDGHRGGRFLAKIGALLQEPEKL